jgi:hypothetical protein
VLVKPVDVSQALGHEELPWVTLIICQQYDARQQGYDLRVVVKAVLVSIQADH